MKQYLKTLGLPIRIVPGHRILWVIWQKGASIRVDVSQDILNMSLAAGIGYAASVNIDTVITVVSPQGASIR